MSNMVYGLRPIWFYDPFGAQAYTMHIQPQRDLPEFGVTFHCDSDPPVMSKEESEAPKTTIKQQKRVHERSRGSMDVSRDRNFSIPPPEYHHPRAQLKRPSPECSIHDPEVICTSSKRKVKHDDDYYEEHPCRSMKKVCLQHHQSDLVSATRPPTLPDIVDLPALPSKSSTEKSISDWKRKASVWARITFPQGESAVYKEKKLGNYCPAVNGSSHHRSHNTTSNGYHEDHRKTAAAASNRYYPDHHNYVLSDDDRHFKRRPSRYESLPSPALKEGSHSSRGWRDNGVIIASIGRLSVY